MKIKKIHFEKFKRFTDLTIEHIPASVKLVVLVGPNGCGKSSLFDGFKVWHLFHGYRIGTNDDYCRKEATDTRNGYKLVNIQFHDDTSSFSQDRFKESFYFRTAYRNSPTIAIRALGTIQSPINSADNKLMIQNDSTVDENYQWLMAATISGLYDSQNDNRTVRSLRDELIGKVREPLHRLFPDLLLTELGSITDKAEFYFDKGTVHRYGYEKLSGGEKAVFDLLLDFVIKNQYYKNTVFCIDEPETHIHTSVQANLLAELFDMISDNSQLWIATHSFGMMKEAKRLSEKYPERVAFLDFDGFDFDEPVTITPSKCNCVLWTKMLEITLDDFAPFMSPNTIVFCEGNTKGRKRKDFDARCYTTIFQDTHPRTLFYSLGNCEDIEKEEQIIEFVKKLSPQAKVIKLIDRDDRSSEEIGDLETKGIKVLSRRHIESYLLDEEVLTKWCSSIGQEGKAEELLSIRQKAVADSINRKNAPDDIKSASNYICTEGKKLLGLTNCGNTGEMIMRDTLAKLITQDMTVYKELEQAIFS